MAKTTEIYSDILSMVDKLICSMETPTDDENINAAKQETLEVLKKLNQEIDEEYASLKKNSEWKRFMIAFYGETNAGKSTIIEALRLAMHEKTKLDAQHNFFSLQKQYDISEEAFDVIREKILRIKDLILDLEKKTEEVKKDLQDVKSESCALISDLEKKVLEERQNWSIIEKIIHYFIKSDLQKELVHQQKESEIAINDITRKNEEAAKELNQTKLDYEAAQSKERQMVEESRKLEAFADGIIIGTGESDYTKTNTTYEFNYNGLEFDLIDVPGIEGNEGIVKDSILEAVQKAHAVFYVTNKPTAPQTGDGREGTLEKIQKHLGAQTEVWTIYNKRANNPIQLEGELLNDEESDALQNLHNVMTSKLGTEHYRGEIAIKGFPAFLSVAQCLVPGSKEMRSQNKFLRKMDREEMMVSSGLKEFIDLFPDTIVGDWKKKIIISNYNKALETLRQVIAKLKSIQNNKFIPLEKNICRIHRDAKQQLENLVDSLHYSLQSIKSDVIGDFESNARSEIYDVISSDVGNDTFKYNLQNILEKNQKALEQEFTRFIQERTALFKDEIEEVIERYKSHLDDTICTYDSIDIGEINLKININSGIDKLAVLGAIMGAIAVYSATGPVGWVLGGISLVISIAKAAWGFLNHSYRREQQRKSADENIRKVSRDISNSLEKYLRELSNKVAAAMPKLENDLKQPMIAVQSINKALSDAQNEFSNMIIITEESMLNE